MKKIFAIVMVVIMAAVFAGCGNTVMTVDMAKIQTGSLKFKNYGHELETKTKQYEEQFKKEAPGMDQATIQKTQQEYYKKIEADRQAVLQKFTTELKAAAQTIAKEKGSDTVMIKDALLVGGTDITDDVLKKLDEGVQAAPAAAATPATSAAPSASGAKK